MRQNAKLLSHTFCDYSTQMIATFLIDFMGGIIDGIVISRFLGTDAMAASSSPVSDWSSGNSFPCSVSACHRHSTGWIRSPSGPWRTPTPTSWT